VSRAGGPAALRLLLVDDHEPSRMLIRAILARSPDPEMVGSTLVEAGSLDQARAELKAGPFDIVLLDVQLPDGSGLSLLRDLPAPPRPAVIALTGGVLPAQRAAALDAGCDAFLDKPFRADDLLALLARLGRRPTAGPPVGAGEAPP
jgi:two-component system KDP operon response regulator KdpE